jgi:hypothetical protein
MDRRGGSWPLTEQKEQLDGLPVHSDMMVVVWGWFQRGCRRGVSDGWMVLRMMIESRKSKRLKPVDYIRKRRHRPDKGFNSAANQIASNVSFT